MDQKAGVIKLVQEIEKLKQESLTEAQACMKEHGEDNPVCNIHGGVVMAYGIVLMKVKEIFPELINDQVKI